VTNEQAAHAALADGYYKWLFNGIPELEGIVKVVGGNVHGSDRQGANPLSVKFCISQGDVFEPVVVLTKAEHDSLTAQLDTARLQRDEDWLVMLHAIAPLADLLDTDSNRWGDADDITLLEQFDPWQTLRDACAEIARLQSELAAAKEWEDVEYNDAINVGNAVQIRVVIDAEKPDRVHLHIRERVGAKWKLLYLTTLKSEYRLIRKRTTGGE
jgi:hypothetical protein